MLFNSLTFLVFLLAVYALYLAMRSSKRAQNTLLLVASYVFYGYWDWRFLILIAFSTVVDFAIGLALGRQTESTPGHIRSRTLYLYGSIAANLGILATFKYFDFFSANFAEVMSLFGFSVDAVTLRLVLPVGISFYTFQTLSYTIDIYRGKLRPTDSLLDFAVFVAFFPQLVAGPIERASRMLPQVQSRRRIGPGDVNIGLFLMLSGYFKKTFVADNAGLIADRVFNSYTDHSGLDILVGTLAFTAQIYGDFSGYSDIARGVARLFGFKLMVNFQLPYFALNPSDFWRRWHISLSTWLRDYLYIPLGGSRGSSAQTCRNLLTTMILGGLWHGAAWNFVLWGIYHGVILVLFRLASLGAGQKSVSENGRGYVGVAGRMVVMFALTLCGWFVFRSNSIEQVSYMLTHLSPWRSPVSFALLRQLVTCTWPLVVLEFWQYISGDLLAPTKLPIGWRICLYFSMLVVLIGLGQHESVEFIYFQF